MSAEAVIYIQIYGESAKNQPSEPARDPSLRHGRQFFKFRDQDS